MVFWTRRVAFQSKNKLTEVTGDLVMKETKEHGGVKGSMGESQHHG
jgi:hypothetical protein